MDILNTIFKKNNAEQGEKEQTTNNIIDNRENIMSLKRYIAKVVREQRANKKVTRSPHNSDTWSYQVAENETRYELFVMYTAYYIVKHYLWTEENKEKMEVYLKKVTEEAKHVLNGDRWMIERFIDKVNSHVHTYTSA